MCRPDPPTDGQTAMYRQFLDIRHVYFLAKLLTLKGLFDFNKYKLVHFVILATDMHFDAHWGKNREHNQVFSKNSRYSIRRLPVY